VNAPAFNVESVELVLNVTMTYVGDLQVMVTSPSGTQSLLAAIRADATDNYVNYIFTSRRHWDEDASGTWTIKIHDGAAQDVATWTNYTFNVFGTP
jgi:subtilisin-like proprotein convertase family protein